MFFEEATGTIADIGQDVAAAVRAVNLLDNSDFTNPVNQRGASSYTPNSSNQYTIDRWKSWSTGIGVGIVDGGVKLSYSGTSEWAQFTQTLEANNWGSKRLTFAICDIDGNVYCGNNVPVSGNNVVVCQIGNVGRLAFELSKSTGNLNAHIYINPSCEITLKWAALYEGEYTAETLPPYVPKGDAAEQLECRRYYQRSYESTPKTGGSDPIMIFLAASSYAGGSVLFPLEMRVTPTVTLYNPDTGNSGVVCDWSNSADVAASPNATRKGFQVRGDGRFTQGKYYGCHYEANADL